METSTIMLAMACVIKYLGSTPKHQKVHFWHIPKPNNVKLLVFHSFCGQEVRLSVNTTKSKVLKQLFYISLRAGTFSATRSQFDNLCGVATRIFICVGYASSRIEWRAQHRRAVGKVFSRTPSLRRPRKKCCFLKVVWSTLSPQQKKHNVFTQSKSHNRQQ